MGRGSAAARLSPPGADPTPVRHVYVHAPFCAQRCGYCDYAVHVDGDPKSRAWLDAIVRELRAASGPDGWVELSPLETLYVGGGTPSLLDPEALVAAGRAMGVGPAAAGEVEWTAEANPESLDRRVARAWAAGGVNRVSIGVQSFQDAALRWLGRPHSGADAESAVRTARASGLANVSVDLLFGLPSEVRRRWRTDLDRALLLGAPHVSIYGLTAEADTPLGRAAREGRIRMPAAERRRDEYLLAAETLARAGYEHYEASNFALPGFASRHGRACWEGAPYLGLGAGAHSYGGGRRWWNERRWPAYRDAVAESGRATVGWEVLGPRASRLEAAWLGLRAATGVALDALDGGAVATIERWERRGLALRGEGRLRLTPQGWLELDELAVALERWVRLESRAAAAEAVDRSGEVEKLP